MKRYDVKEPLQPFLKSGQKQLKYNHMVEVSLTQYMDTLIRYGAKYSELVAKAIRNGEI